MTGFVQRRRKRKRRRFPAKKPAACTTARPSRQTHVTLEPIALLRRLTTLIPPPRVHLTRFHGAFAPAAHLRAAVVALAPESTAGVGGEASANTERDRDASDDATDALAARRARYRWAALLARVFSIDVSCADPACGARASIIASITDPEVIRKRKLLAHLGIELHPTITPLARPPPPVPLDLESI